MRLLRQAQELAAELKASGLRRSHFAAASGVSPSSVSKRLSPLTAEGLALVALEEDRIRSTETLRLFRKLDQVAQRRLLEQSRQSGRVIGERQKGQLGLSADQVVELGRLAIQLDPEEVRELVAGRVPPAVVRIARGWLWSYSTDERERAEA